MYRQLRAGQPDRPLLVALPPAGAIGEYYRPWVPHLPPGWALGSLDRPGSLTRPAGRRRIAMADLAAETATVLTPALQAGRAVVLFGHSMGALLAYETTRLLAARAAGLPTVLGICGTPAPHRWPQRPDSLGARSDDELRAALLRWGVDAEVLAHRELTALVIAGLRADLAVCDGYRFVPTPPPAVPMLLFAGAFDDEARPGQVAEWAAHACAPPPVHTYPAGHDVALTRGRDIIEVLEKNCR